MTDVWASMHRECRLLIKNRVNLLLGLIPPAIYMLFFATSIRNVIPSITYHGTQVSYQDFIIPTILMMSMIAGATTTATSVFQEKISGMLLELWSYPLRKTSYIIGKLVTTTALVCLQGCVMLMVALALFGSNWSFNHILALLIGIVWTSLSLNGLYLFIATQFRQQQHFMIAINVLAPILIFASPSFYQQAQMPLVVRTISYINPVTYGITTLRDGLLYGITATWSTLLVLVVLTVVSTVGTSYMLLARFHDL